MSFTQTPNYGLYKPTINSDNDQWGDHLNSNADTLDTTIKTLAPLVSPPLTGTPTVPTAAPGTATTQAASTAFVAAALGTVVGGAVVAATPPTASPGALWWDSTGGQLYVRYADADSTAWVVANTGAPGRGAARLQAQWVTGAVVANDTVWLAYDAPYAGTVNALTYFTGNGSFSVAVQINGVNVTGLSAVAVNSATPATTSATAANIFTAGQRITAVITGATGSPTDALLSLAVTWS